MYLLTYIHVDRYLLTVLYSVSVFSLVDIRIVT